MKITIEKVSFKLFKKDIRNYEHRNLANSDRSNFSCFTFCRGKISSLMGDVAKGIKSFKKGMASDVTDELNQKIFDNQDPNNQDPKDKE